MLPGYAKSISGHSKGYLDILRGSIECFSIDGDRFLIRLVDLRNAIRREVLSRFAYSVLLIY
jgi:hypothetical protein